MGALYRLTPEWLLLAGVRESFDPLAPSRVSDEESSLNVVFGVRCNNSKASFESTYVINDYDNLVGTVTDSTGGGGETGDQIDGGDVTVNGLDLSARYGWSVDMIEVPL